MDKTQALLCRTLIEDFVCMKVVLRVCFTCCIEMSVAHTVLVRREDPEKARVAQIMEFRVCCLGGLSFLLRFIIPRI